MKNDIKELGTINNQVLDEISILNSTIEMVRNYCVEKENKSVYYGLNKEGIKKISGERNNYINLLSIATNQISSILSLSLVMENKISLNQNSDNCSR